MGNVPFIDNKIVHFVDHDRFILTNYYFSVCIQADTLTTSHGHPIDNKKSSMTVGPRGPMLMQDFVYTDEMAHFDRERIPERVVHAKGAG